MPAKALVDYIDVTVRLSIDARNTNMLRLLDACIDDLRCRSVTATKTETDTFIYSMQLRDAVRVAVRAAAFGRPDACHARGACGLRKSRVLTRPLACVALFHPSGQPHRTERYDCDMLKSTKALCIGLLLAASMAAANEIVGEWVDLSYGYSQETILLAYRGGLRAACREQGANRRWLLVRSQQFPQRRTRRHAHRRARPLRERQATAWTKFHCSA